MQNLKLYFLFSTLFISVTLFSQTPKDDLDKYVERLRSSKASGGSETAYLSAGSDFLYAQDYFEAKNYYFAANSYRDVVNKEKDNPYANYLLAISLIRQNDKYKTIQAQEYLQKAFNLKPTLKERYNIDVPAKENPTLNNVVQTTINNAEGLEGYIDKLKYSRTTGGAATSMGTAGLEALYGVDYYENGKYRSAELSFDLSLAKDPENIYVNYLKAVCMVALGRKTEAQPYFTKALAGDPTLKNRYNKDIASAITKENKSEESKNIKSTAVAKVVNGGQLIYGDYTCTQTVWNGPGRSPAYRFPYKGYFALKADGTYRWLDNGGSGKYKYDPDTGNITWLSGEFKNSAAKSSKYQISGQTAQITVNYSDSYRWECSCKKK